MSVQPAVGPGLELAERRRELLALLGELVADLHRRLLGDMTGDDPALLELLHALGQQAVAELRHRLGDLGEAQAAAVQQDVEDRAGPALADQLDGLVVAGTAAGPFGGLFEGRSLRAPPGAHGYHAARSTRVSSKEPSTGTSPATLIIAVKDSRDSTAIASSSCSSLQPASRASSCRCCGPWARSVSSGLR